MGWKFEIKILGLYFFLHGNLNAIFFSMECIKKAGSVSPSAAHGVIKFSH